MKLRTTHRPVSSTGKTSQSDLLLYSLLLIHRYFCRGEPIPENMTRPDIILASDCVYLEVAFQPLIDTLMLLTDENTEIYMSYRKRRKADKRFFQMARKKFNLTEVEDPKQSSYKKEGLRLYQLMKKVAK